MSVNKKEKEILEEAKINWNTVYGKTKYLLWEKVIDDFSRNYMVLTKELFLSILKNSFEELLKNSSEDEINFETVFDYAFDNEVNGLIPFYNPIDFLNDENYKYIYLICHNHNAEYRTHIETIIYSNTKIESIAQISKLLKNKEPKEFNILWVNHYFNEINCFETNDLYNMIDEDANKLDNVERIYF